LEEENKMKKMPFEKCPVCGGKLVEKTVEKLLKGGHDVAIINVCAEICLKCGERLYAKETVQKFEEIRFKLEHRQVKTFKPMGKLFQAA
jgi:YgiT-type zinc finger domain-containing protein